MKKLKNIFCLSVLAISTFCIMGITDVKAGSAEQFQVVCDQKSVEPGQTANCFLIAKILNGDISFVETTITPDTSGNYQTKNLKITRVEGPPINGDVAATTLVHNGKLADLGLGDNHKESGAKNYVCNNETTYTEASYKGCQLFYALKNKKIKPVTNGSDNGVPVLNSGYDGYTVIGFYVVTLSDDATINDCGRLCISPRFGENDGDAQADMQGATKHCAEIEVKPGENPGTPGTGNFTSYLVLIGAAFVAVGAIALAKRNSKLFRV